MNNYINEIGSVERETLVLGTYPTITDAISIIGAASFSRGDVVVRGADGSIALADASAASAAGVPSMGVICDGIVVKAGETAAAAMYIKGEFNRRALNFAKGTTADDLRNVMAAIGLIVRETRV